MEELYVNVVYGETHQTFNSGIEKVHYDRIVVTQHFEPTIVNLPTTRVGPIEELPEEAFLYAKYPDGYAHLDVLDEEE